MRMIACTLVASMVLFLGAGVAADKPEVNGESDRRNHFVSHTLDEVIRPPDVYLGDSMPKILIADDHAVVRKGLMKILTESDAGISVDEAGDGQEALTRVLRERYELVLLDISMPGRGGLEVLKEIRSYNFV